MALDILVAEVVCTFFLALGLLYRYGNLMRNHLIVTVSVFIAWYFSFLIIFVLPLDVSYTIERQCLGDPPEGNATAAPADGGNGSVAPPCQVQTVYKRVLPSLWRVVYWSSQCLTWLVLPLMQSYIKAGDFTVRGKLRSALVDNAIYYGSYLFICGVLLVYIALQPSLELDGQKLKAIASSASNTWGLFLLVLLLGYGLVQVPRALWDAGRRGYLLHYSYFRAAKLSAEKCEAEETVDDILESLQAAAASIGPGHPLHRNLETIFQKVPIELRERMGRRQLPQDTPADPPSYKALVRLHRQILKALQTQHRTETQWALLVDEVIALEDVACNQVSHERRFRPTFQPARSAVARLLWGPTAEWYWKCVIHGHVLKLLSVACGAVSLAVVWSEVTFFNKEPVLSLFALFVDLATADGNYVAIQVVSTLIIAYLCYCAYSTVLRIRFLNLYYLAPHHQTDEYSLIFAGMMLCRLTPPMCLNFLGLIHMDSHVIKRHISETYYTQVMGHMDVVSIISDGFNVYFPMAMVVFCLATYFNLGSRLLSALGFHQFLGDDEVTSDLVDEGRELVKREKRRRQRAEDSVNRRREFQERFGSTLKYRTARQTPEDRVRTLRRDDSTESARAVLLRDVEPVDCYPGNTMNSASTEGSDRYCSSLELEVRGRVDRVGFPSSGGFFDDV
ncbi:LMBR1 domain-containing protein 2 homolog [Bacillus rossius redtenbacheri]|uniref:LMBR1 domain-containing protein 2 homolog n=1 Tax=Bacillus rossius redtenbacheri TaxID=93214 RepID=UPI002FDDCD3E